MKYLSIHNFTHKRTFLSSFTHPYLSNHIFFSSMKIKGKVNGYLIYIPPKRGEKKRHKSVQYAM